MKKTKNVISELDKLYEEVGSFRASEDYEKLLFFIKRFRNITPYNAMLLHIQKPGSRYVATAEDWQRRFHRHPRTGARPLIMLRPFGPVTFVYELGDTEGEPFPIELEQPFKAEGRISDAQFHRFRNSMFLSGIGLIEQDYGTELAGFVQTTNRQVHFDGKRRRIEFLQPYCVALNQNLDNAAKMATLYHELAHVYCGHLNNPEVEYLPQRYMLPTDVEEFEAESVCWLLCERRGIKNPSASYLSNYVSSKGEIPPISIECVLKAVTAIEEIERGVNLPKKELRIDEYHQITLFNSLEK